MKIETATGQVLGLAGKTAVVTGGAVNIGRAISRKLASYGVKTVIVYNSSSAAAEESANEINKAGGIAAAFQADVSSEQSVENLFKKIEADDNFGRVDIMVNNSGVFSMSEQTKLSAFEWKRLFDINTLGTFLCAREAAKRMKTVPPLNAGDCSGAIINIASINALHPGFGLTVHYDATKGAVYSFTRSLAAELGPCGIRVNGVAPGLVDSENLRQTAAPLAETVEKRNPLACPNGTQSLVKADDVANTVVFLASGLSSAVTGEVVVVDRGYLLT